MLRYSSEYLRNSANEGMDIYRHRVYMRVHVTVVKQAIFNFVQQYRIGPCKSQFKIR